MRLIQTTLLACACIIASEHALPQTVQEVIRAKESLGTIYLPEEKRFNDEIEKLEAERAMAIERARRERSEALQRRAGERTSANGASLPSSSVRLVQRRYETYYGRNNERRRRTLCEYSDGRIVEYGDDCPLTIP